MSTVDSPVWLAVRSIVPHNANVPDPLSMTPGLDRGRSSSAPRSLNRVEQRTGTMMSATLPAYGIAAIVTDGSLRAFCSVCPWWSADVGRSYDVSDYRRSSYARARAELTRHILTPDHAERRVSEA